MISLTTMPQTPVRDHETDDPFFEYLRSSNPFMENRVNGSGPRGIDVHEIHHAAFEELTVLARTAYEMRCGLGALLWGEAGVGKSHLLARLMRWAQKDQQAIAIYVHNVQASPENLPRSLLKTVITSLTSGHSSGFNKTPLFALVAGVVCEAVSFNLGKYSWKTLEPAYHRFVDQLSSEDFALAAPVDRTTFAVLWTMFRAAHKARRSGNDQLSPLATRWLAGESLSADDARTLGVRGSRDEREAIALADNQAIKHVLVTLSRMAQSCKKPFIFCFDQVDNLDDDQASALFRFLEALIDCVPNLLVVTAGIKASLLRWRDTKVFQESAWDRLAQFPLTLQRLSPAESRVLVAKRLEQTLAPYAGLGEVQRLLQTDDLFPLGKRWADAFLQDAIDQRPRDVINAARQGWRREQQRARAVGPLTWLNEWGQDKPAKTGEPVRLTGEQVRQAIEVKVTQKIEEFRGQFRQRPDSLYLNAEDLAGLYTVLLRLVDRLEVQAAPAGKPTLGFPYHLIVSRTNERGNTVRTAILFVVTDQAAAATASLRWLASNEPAPGLVLLITEERQPLPLDDQAAAKGREYLAQLMKRGPAGFQHLNLSFDDHARLAAYRATLGLARAGDLEVELQPGSSRPIIEEEVLQTLREIGIPILQ
jgi:hypothetical protein